MFHSGEPWFRLLLEVVAIGATGLVLLATVPVLAGLYQYLLVAFSLLHTHLERVAPAYPRVSILIPAWNEESVIAATIDRLMTLHYPQDKLRVYVVDDGSTDDTPTLVIEKSQQYPGRVIHVRRVDGGQGKAHTLNYGLEVLWKSPWTEAVLIMDADVIYTRDSLARMCRHLADPKVGAVTAYIKEGSSNPNYLQRYIGFEYITATGASRRAQNVLGFLACLSGGAQLHTRENLDAIGGKIFSHTLAEDTFTTFRTQLAGRSAIFEPNAIVYAEEPDTLDGLWKQRVRWARGNVQITKVFRRLWFNRRAHPQMGGLSMGVLWFSIFLMPVFQLGAASSLIVLYFLNEPLSWALFRGLWVLAAVVYVVVTIVSYGVDGESAQRTWGEGILFPGLISLGLIVYSLWPPLLQPLLELVNIPVGSFWEVGTRLFLYSWLALSMAVAWSAKLLEKTGGWGKRFAPWVLHVAGYGPFLCAVTFGAYILEWRGADMKWDKTIKTGKVAS